jgi:enterochelin esterase-like enzyme
MSFRWITPFLLGFSLAATALADETGSLAAPEEQRVAPSARMSYVIDAHGGELVTGIVETAITSKVDVTLSAPGETVARRFEGPSRSAIDFHFVARETGAHRLEVLNRGSADALVRIRIESRVAADVANEPSRESAREGSRIAALRKAIEREGAGAVASFWKDVARDGTPLVEPDGDQYLVTFLWRGTPASDRVQLFWPVRTELRELELSRIGETDVWFKSVVLPRGTRLSYRIAPGIPRVPGKTRDRGAILAVAQADPLNPKRWPARADASPFDVSSVLELDAPPQPWMELSDGVAAPRIESHTISSRILRNERTLSVIVPNDVSAGEPYALAVVFDEDAYLERTPAPVIVANLVAAKKIPRTLVVLVGNPTRDSRARELPPNREFADFLATELVPWIRERWPVTTDPKRVVVAGSSYGGIAATFAAMTHPEVFGNVLSQSGSFWWAGEEDAEPNVIARWFAAEGLLPVRFYLAAGAFESGLAGEHGGILEHNRHFRDVLVARGYDVHYREVQGGHDHLSWRGTFAEGLQVLLGDAHQLCPTGVTREVAIERSEQHTIVANSDPSRAYRLLLSIPDTPPPPNGFPIIYLLDGNASFATMVEAVRQIGGSDGAQRAVIAGISVATGKRYDSDARKRDYAGSGADAFLDVLELQIKPFIEQRTRIDRSRQALFGHSLGGLFVLHALFTRPGSFQNYVAASPSIWWNDRAILVEEQRLKPLPPGVSVLVTVGELEQNVLARELDTPAGAERAKTLAQRRMVDASRELAQRLKALAPDARVEHVEFAGETHGSVVPAAIMRAVRFAIGETR